jgi:EmrB/QacA subfamily drug resistance transporter
VVEDTPPPGRHSGVTAPEIAAVEHAAASEPFAILPEFPEDARPTTGDPSSAAAGTRRPALVLAVLAAATFLGSLDLLIVNVALNPIGRGIGETNLADLSWVLNAYAIVFAALLVPAGRLADRYGRKHGFLLGLLVFTLASLGAALPNDLWLLIGFRVLQAAGAALMTPASLGLVLATAPADRVTKYVQVWAASGSLAAAAGPALGGLLVEASWRWIFLVNIPVGVTALVLAARLIPDVRHDGETRIPDPTGAVLLIAGIGALALGLVKAPGWGWGSAGTVITLAAATALLVLFVVRSATAQVPILELRLFRDPVFSAGNIAALFFYASFVVQLLGIILWLQQQWGWSAVSTGFAIAPGPCMVFAASVVARRIERRVPVGVIAGAGAVLSALGIAIVTVSTTSTHLDYGRQVLPGWVLGGIGIGLALPTIFSSATRDLAPHQAATGSAVVNMAAQIGSVLGASLLVIFLADQGGGDAHDVFAIAWWTAFGLALVSAVAALGLSQRRPTTTRP